MEESATIDVHPDNQASAEAWNSDDGEHWVEHADSYDRSLAHHTPSLLEAAAIGRTDAVLDIGCGSGHLTLEAGRLAPSGRALGIDVSRPLLDDARSRAGGVNNVDFVLGDAQVHHFEPGAFDVVISRTGTLFFADQVAAFANFGASGRPGARLAAIVWQGIDANDWFREFNEALDAGRPPARPPIGVPGPFVFAEPRQARDILETAGWTDVDLVGHQAPMWFGPDAEAAYAFVSTQAPTNFRLSDLAPDAREAALAKLRSTLERHESADGVTYESAVWIVTARRP